MSIVCVECPAQQWLGFAPWLRTKAHKLTSTMSPGTALSWSLLTCVFLFPNIHNTNSGRIEFGLVLLLGHSVIFNVQFIIVH
jgi:hypothetical protein